MIQDMIRASVFTSGAGTSRSAPSSDAMSKAYRRVSRSSSPSDSEAGSTTTPPFAPPNGMSTTAHLIVMSAASAITSRTSTAGWNRIPPLPGPRAVLCCTRQPVNTSRRPSSRRIGIATSRIRSGVTMSWVIQSSSPSRFAASSIRARMASQESPRSSVIRSPRQTATPASVTPTPLRDGPVGLRLGQ